MSRRLAEWVEATFRRVTPDPFVLAILLTAAAWLAGLFATGFDLLAVVDAWRGGLWSLLAFGMQMCLVLVTGHAVASSRPMRRLLERLANEPRSPGGAAALVAAVSMGLGLFNWGLGLVGGGLLARAVGASCARRGIRVHYPLLAACGYAGMLVWHGGFSGSAPLKVTNRADLVELLGPDLGARLDPVPLQATLLSDLNLVATGGLWILIPLFAAWLARRDSPEQIDDVLTQPLVEVGPTIGRRPTVSDSRWVGLLLALPLAMATARYYWVHGIDRLDPNAVNLTLLTVGLVLHQTPAAYGRAVQDAVSGCAGIILQFPLYAGIMGVASGTGIASRLADWAAGASPAGFLVQTFLSAGFLNLLVPSGGGQWAVQGAVVAEAAERLGVPLGRAVMAVAYGDQWTNMLQPFWALPLLGITGVRAGALVGITFGFLILSGLWLAACLYGFASFGLLG